MPKSTKALQKDFKSKASLEIQVSKLKEENVALQATVTKLLQKIDEIRDIDPDSIITRGFSPEQEIIEVQIARLQAVSRERELTLDETRTLDLHLKNKRLIDKELKDALEAEYRDLSDDDLMKEIENEQNSNQEETIIEIGSKEEETRTESEEEGSLA